MDVYLAEKFYYPLGLRHFSFNPLVQFELDQIVPTERDRLWRKTLGTWFCA